MVKDVWEVRMIKKPKPPYRWGQVPIAWEVLNKEKRFVGFIEGGTNKTELNRRVKALDSTYILSGKYIFKGSNSRWKYNKNII